MRIAAAVFWWAALVPLAALLWKRRDAPSAFWIVALAFSVSWFADAYALWTGGSWGAVPWYLAVQWALFVLALTKPGVGPLMPAIACYVGLGTVFWLGMMQHRGDPAPYTAFMAYWWPYQVTRLASFTLFLGATWRTRTAAPLPG